MLELTEDHEEIVARVAGLDIGKAELVCCVRVPGPGGSGRRAQEVVTYSTMTRSLLVMVDRLTELGVTRVVMEATSDYWKPAFYLLEAAGFDPWLVDAGAVKHLPGRPKTRQAGRGVAGEGRRAGNDPSRVRAPRRDPGAAGPDPVPGGAGR